VGRGARVSSSTIKKLSDLKPDTRNANRGTKRGSEMIQASLKEYGAGRSILLDKHGNIIAGNKTAENFGALGHEDVLVVQTNGDQLVAVQRMDLDLALLKPERFACFVVGDVRDRKGFYRGFVADTIRAFEDCGAHLYNEAILVTAVGSLPIRIGTQFGRYRKLGKTHQNVLVFYNGEPKNIRAHFPEDVPIRDMMAEGDTDGSAS